MIITAPTGLYATIMPKGPADPTSIIYTISNNDPPRDNQQFQKLPLGIRNATRPARLFNSDERRAVLGELVLTAKASSAVTAADGAKLYNYGQVLDFTDNTGGDTIVIDDREIVTRHNTSVIDAAKVGISADDEEIIGWNALSTQEIILADIDRLLKIQKQLEADIAEYQKTINEIGRTILGLDTILGVAPSDDIISIKNKLLSKKEITAKLLGDAIDEINSIPAQIQTKRDGLVALTELVK